MKKHNNHATLTVGPTQVDSRGQINIHHSTQSKNKKINTGTIFIIYTVCFKPRYSWCHPQFSIPCICTFCVSALGEQKRSLKSNWFNSCQKPLLLNLPFIHDQSCFWGGAFACHVNVIHCQVNKKKRTKKIPLTLLLTAEYFISFHCHYFSLRYRNIPALLERLYPASCWRWQIGWWGWGWGCGHG